MAWIRVWRIPQYLELFLKIQSSPISSTTLTTASKLRTCWLKQLLRTQKLISKLARVSAHPQAITSQLPMIAFSWLMASQCRSPVSWHAIVNTGRQLALPTACKGFKRSNGICLLTQQNRSRLQLHPLMILFLSLESQALIAISASLCEYMTLTDMKSIPKLAPMKDFPYRETTGK